MTLIENDKYVGMEYGIYKIDSVTSERDKWGHLIYKGICKVCGYEKLAPISNFNRKDKITTSCTHVNKNGDYKTFNTYSWGNERIGRIFKGMVRRCYSQNCKSYRWYGGKGIRIYNEWIDNPKSFEEWALNNGYDDNLTIDRINEDEDYCPDNCRWITNANNSKYKSTTHMINVDGESHAGRDWAEILGLSTNIINTYVRKYGEENTKEFIHKYLNNPISIPKHRQSYYDLYMNKEIQSQV